MSLLMVIVRKLNILRELDCWCSSRSLGNCLVDLHSTGLSASGFRESGRYFRKAGKVVKSLHNGKSLRDCVTTIKFRTTGEHASHVKLSLVLAPEKYPSQHCADYAELHSITNHVA